VTRTRTNEETGDKYTNVYCPLPGLPADLDCAVARTQVPDETAGWYYCEDSAENFDDACSDGVDDDGDGKTDCEDDGCLDCMQACEGVNPNATGVHCAASCRFGVHFTYAVRDVARGKVISIKCEEDE
jgi:hypothetical protein